MENPDDELSVLDYMRLMRDFLNARIDAQQYAKGYFDITTTRIVIPNEEVSRITQQAYGDADDYEPDAKLRKENPRWIGEAELKIKVTNSLRELEALGYTLNHDDGGIR